MHRVTKRTWLIYVFLLTLVFGMVFFLWEYATKAHQWVGATGSPHLYNNSNLGCGTVVDRSGTILLDITTSRSYSEDTTTRKSTPSRVRSSRRRGEPDASTSFSFA